MLEETELDARTTAADAIRGTVVALGPRGPAVGAIAGTGGTGGKVGTQVG